MYHMYTHRVHNIEKRTSRSEKNIMSPCLSLHSLRTDRRSFLDTKAPPVAQLGPNAQASSFPLLGAPEFLSRALPCWSAVFIKGNRSDILDREWQGRLSLVFLLAIRCFEAWWSLVPQWADYRARDNTFLQRENKHILSIGEDLKIWNLRVKWHSLWHCSSCQGFLMAWAAASHGRTICEFSEDPGEAVNWIRVEDVEIVISLNYLCWSQIWCDLDNKT